MCNEEKKKYFHLPKITNVFWASIKVGCWTGPLVYRWWLRTSAGWLVCTLGAGAGGVGNGNLSSFFGVHIPVSGGWSMTSWKQKQVISTSYCFNIHCHRSTIYDGLKQSQLLCMQQKWSRKDEEKVGKSTLVQFIEHIQLDMEDEWLLFSPSLQHGT